MDGLTATYYVTSIFASCTVGITVVIGMATFRAAIRDRRAASLDRVFAELRDPQFTELAKTVYEHFPLVDEPTTAARMRVFLDEFLNQPTLTADEQKKHIHDAVLLVNRLNNIGAMIEQSAVREKDFHGQYHPRIIELAARLDSFLLIKTELLGYRWGMRVRRIADGGRAYYRTSILHNSKPLKRGDITLVEATSGWLWRISREARRAHRGQYMPTAKSVRSRDEHDMQEAKEVLATYGAALREIFAP